MMVTKLWTAIRFLVFGVLGLMVSLFCSVGIIVRLTEPPIRDTFPSVWLMSPLMIVAFLMMLFGVGAWGRWAYLWVLASIPGSLALGFFFAWVGERLGWEYESKVPAPLLVALILGPFGASAAVRYYYRAKAQPASSAALNRQ